MINVIISHPNGQRQEVLLAGVPRKGEHVRLSRSEVSGPSLVVEHILWVEGYGNSREPSVVIAVRPHAEGPP